MNSIVGFTIYWNIDDLSQQRAISAQQNALSNFKQLNVDTIDLGQTHIELWGHGKLSDLIFKISDGSIFILVGSPAPIPPIHELKNTLQLLSESGNYTELPWDGRYILLKVSSDGNCWTMWNDWLGSIPVFYANQGNGQIASSLEPVVVSAKGFTQDDIFLPGLIYLLIHGHLISDWTIFKGMATIPADCKAFWRDNNFKWQRLNTVKATDDRWEFGWDELVDEMHYLSRQAIIEVLGQEQSWILPLSSGLDSRLIAAVGAEKGADIRTFTWGTPGSSDTIFAKQIAQSLQLPWEWIDFGTNFMEDFTKTWVHLFGSSMDFHGIYLMPFLDETQSIFSAPYLIGLIGEALAGFDVQFQSLLHSSPEQLFQSQPSRFLRWQPDEVRELLKIKTEEAFDEISSEIEKTRNYLPGPWFQRIRFLVYWGRQRFFTSFQSTLCGYWKGVATPYLNRAYARFCLSLPRAILEERRLQADVFRRYYPKIAEIPGTYGGNPLILKGDYMLKRKLANTLPKVICPNSIRSYAVSVNHKTWDQNALRENGYRAIWPIRESRDYLSEWLNTEILEQTYQEARNGSFDAVMKMKAIQPFALRMNNYFYS